MAKQEQQQEAKSRRDAFRGRLSEKYPDMSFDDEEVMYGRIDDDYTDYENRIADYEKTLTGYKDRERELSDMFTKNPLSAKFLSEWRRGDDPFLGLIRSYGKENMDEYMRDPDKISSIEKANKEYLERVAEEERLESEYKKNLEQSLSDISSLQEKEGYTDEEIDKAVDILQEVTKNVIVGKISADVVKMALNAMNYNRDVENASMEGELRGKNTKIQEKLRTRGKGDGIPQMDGKNGAGAGPMKKRDLGALDTMSERGSIWDK